MITSDDKHIKEWLSRWSQKHTPVMYHFYKDEKGFGYVLGQCSGIAVFPRTFDSNDLIMIDLREDDGMYFLNKDNRSLSVGWVDDRIKCLQVVKSYLEKYATPLYYIGAEEVKKNQCGWQLPWKNERNDKFWIKEDNYWVRKDGYSFCESNYNKELMIRFIDELRYLIHSKLHAHVYVKDDEIEITIHDKDLCIWDVKSSKYVAPKISTYYFNPYLQIGNKDDVIYKLLVKYHNLWPNKSKMEINLIGKL